MKMMKTRACLLPVLVSSVVLVMTSCGRNVGAPKHHVKLLLDWKAGAEHAFVYYGLKKNFFADEGIDLEIIAGEGSSDSVTQINGKAVDFALCAGETALLAVAAQQPRPVKMLACFYWTTPTEIFSIDTKSIVKPEDLYGKRLGVVKGSSGYRNYLAFARSVGLDRSRIKEVPCTGDVREMLGENAEIDALVQFFYQEPLQLKLAGYKLHEIRFDAAGIQVYGQGLITHEDTLQNHTLIKGMTRAIQRSWQATLVNPDAVVDVFLALHPGPSETYSYAKIKEVVGFVKEGMTRANVKVIGEQTATGWISTYQYLRDQQMLQRTIDPEVVWTNDYLDRSIVLP